MSPDDRGNLSLLMLDLRNSLRVVLTSARWWSGLTYVVAGVWGCIAGPISIGHGDYGGVYLIVGGSALAALGWAIHPWGLQRRNARHSAVTPRT
jgi:hypothetical protein